MLTESFATKKLTDLENCIFEISPLGIYRNCLILVNARFIFLLQLIRFTNMNSVNIDVSSLFISDHTVTVLVPPDNILLVFCVTLMLNVNFMVNITK